MGNRASDPHGEEPGRGASAADCLLTALPLLPTRIDTAEDLARAEEVLRIAMAADEVRLRVVRKREPATDAPGAPVDALVLPIVADSEVVAHMEVRWREDAETARATMRTLGQALAAELAARVQVARLLKQQRHLQEELARRDFNLYTVYHISKTLGGILDLTEVLGHVTDMMAEVMTVRGCYVLLPGEDQESFTVRGWRTPMRTGTPPPLELRETEQVPEWLERLEWESQPVWPLRDESFARVFPDAVEALREAGIQIVVPLIYKKRLVGLLALEEKYTGGGFTEDDLQFLAVLGPLASNAVSNAQLYEQAILDGLTRLYVVRYFRQRCREEIKRAYRYGKPVSLILWDIDNFKRVNDTHGHLVGDQVLRELGQMMRQSSRIDVDIVARYGGEEFVMLLPETPREGAIILAERVRGRIERHTFTSRALKITISGGIASFPIDARDYASLVARADDELFRAKRLGRNRICAVDTAPEAIQRAAQERDAWRAEVTRPPA